MQRVEKLATVGMIIGAPDQCLPPRSYRAVGVRFFGTVAPGEEVAASDGVVPSVKGFTPPPEFEDSLGDAILIARILVNRASALRRPADDLDREALWLVDKASIAPQVFVSRGNERRVLHLPHAGHWHIGNLGQIKIFHGALYSMDLQLDSPETGAEQRRKALGDNNNNKGDDQQQRNELILEQAHRREQLKADAAGADKAKH